MPAAILFELRSLIAIPLRSGDRVTGMWYFDRRGRQEIFDRNDLQRAAFFSSAAGPALEIALKSEFARRGLETGAAPGPGPGPGKSPYEDLVGNSKPMTELYRQMRKVAAVDISVLIEGESGTGKELVARNLHRNSRRASGRFLALNCSALPETLIESELFGYNRGAFTGATTTRQGLIEQANGGTLFLDEIGDLSPAAQAKLLRVLQEREVQRLGDPSVRKVDVRFLFATHKDLKKLVQTGTYRQDLFYRISVYRLVVPPLRERRDDVPQLIAYLTRKYSRSMGRGNVHFSASAMRLLCDYSWPGNVREMENVIQSVLVNCESESIIEASALPEHISADPPARRFGGMTLEEGRDQFEREFILQALNRHRWNKTHAAQELKVTRQGLVNMIQRLGIMKEE